MDRRYSPLASLALLGAAAMAAPASRGEIRRSEGTRYRAPSEPEPPAANETRQQRRARERRNAKRFGGAGPA